MTEMNCCFICWCPILVSLVIKKEDKRESGKIAQSATENVMRAQTGLFGLSTELQETFPSLAS